MLKLIFYTKLLFLAKNVQILNIREYLIGSLLNNSLLNCLYLHLSLNCLNIKITLNESDKITYNRLVCYFDFIHRSNSARYAWILSIQQVSLRNTMNNTFYKHIKENTQLMCKSNTILSR